MHVGTRNVLHALAAAIFVATIALQTWAKAGADPEATDVITVVAVDAAGQPANGYRVEPRLVSSPNLSGCLDPSPAAVDNNIYACEPSEAGASVCWPAPGSVLCMRDPWEQTLRGFYLASALPAVDAPQTPMPFALLLDDGTRCLLGGSRAWGGRADGLVAAYGCGLPTWSYAVLVSPDQGLPAAIDRSKPLWTVQTGELGPPTTPFQSPRPRKVMTAWFAGNAG